MPYLTTAPQHAAVWLVKLGLSSSPDTRKTCLLLLLLSFGSLSRRASRYPTIPILGVLAHIECPTQKNEVHGEKQPLRLKKFTAKTNLVEEEPVLVSLTVKMIYGHNCASSYRHR